MLHHNISYHQNQLEYAGKKIEASSFKIINEIIYQYVLFNTGNSLYERNILYSALYNLLDKKNEKGFENKFINFIDKKLDSFIFINSTNIEYRTIYNIENTKGVIFNYIKHYNRCLFKGNLDENTPSILVKDEYVISPGRCYLIKLDNQKQYLIPSELIIKNPELTFTDIKDWIYPKELDKQSYQ